MAVPTQLPIAPLSSLSTLHSICQTTLRQSSSSYQQKIRTFCWFHGMVMVYGVKQKRHSRTTQWAMRPLFPVAANSQVVNSWDIQGHILSSTIARIKNTC